jgi:hypothetical protein
MPRYFFTTADGTREPDLDGTELPDVASARVEAIKYAGEVLSDHPEIIWDGEDFRVEVSDANGLVLFTVVTMAMNSPSTAAS